MTDFTLADQDGNEVTLSSLKGSPVVLYFYPKDDTADSYTRALIDKGVAHCAKKMGEEAFETAIAAVQEDKSRLVSETADVLYHLMVLLKARGIALSDVGLISANIMSSTANSDQIKRVKFELFVGQMLLDGSGALGLQ